MKYLALIIVVATALCSRAEPPTLPTGPLVASGTPSFFRWTITCSYPEGKSEAELAAIYKATMQKTAENDPALAKLLAAQPGMLDRKPRMHQALVSKTGEVRLEETTYTNGQHGQCWKNENTVFTRDAFSGKLTVGVNETPEIQLHPDFPEFAWINAQNFTGVKSVGGVQCMIFEGMIEVAQVEDPRAYAMTGSIGSEEAISKATAAINLETRMPVSLQFRDQLRKYEYPPAPTSVLTIPSEVVAAIQQAARRTQARNAPLSSP